MGVVLSVIKIRNDLADMSLTLGAKQTNNEKKQKMIYFFVRMKKKTKKATCSLTK
jgi:hypothetical protein